MKKFCVIAFTYAFLGICLFSGCDLSEMSSLRDVSRPYVGEYKCKKLQLGGEDYSGDFEFITLALTYDGAFKLKYADVNGGEGAYQGTYKISEEQKTVTLSSPSRGKEETYVFLYEKGKIVMTLPMGEKLLYAEFSMAQ